MNFPSPNFDSALAALCDGTATADVANELYSLLARDESARDEYLWQVEVHNTLAWRAGVMPRVAPAMGERRNPQRKWFILAGIGLVAASLSAVAIWQSWNAPARPMAQWSDRLSEPVDNELPPAKLGDLAIPVARDDGADQELPASASMLGVYRKTVCFAAAASAPIIVGSGRKVPIELGARVPYEESGNTLHIWDWSKSPKSRVLQDTRLWPEDIIALSPDGRWLVWAGGQVIDLVSEARSQIDLGGALYVDNAGGTLKRILNLAFTPDGRQLVILLSNLHQSPSSHPLRKLDFTSEWSIQVVEFPSTKLISEIKASVPVALSPDGQQAAVASPPRELQQRIDVRDIASGEVLRTLEPTVRGYAYALEFSPDGSRLIVFDGAGEVLIWETDSGKLLHRIDVRQITNSSAVFRFSPDGKRLAVGVLQKTLVLDVASGEIVSSMPTNSPSLIQWSADGRLLHVVSNVTVGSIFEGRDKSGRMRVFNIFPSVRTLDWKTPVAK